MSGRPFFGLPMTTTLVFGLSTSFSVELHLLGHLFAAGRRGERCRSWSRP